MKNLLLLSLTIVFTSVSYLNAQTNFTKDPNNPIFRRDTTVANLPNDIYAISDCWVLKDGATYKMWYTAGGFNYPPDTLMRSRITYATSTDGISWNKYSGNPVLDVSYTGGWDSLGVETVSILIDSSAPVNQRYKMWYAGQNTNEYRYDIGYAYSPDGINWTKHPNRVLQVGSSSEWDSGFLEGPSVIKDGNTYKMWYCGYDAIVNGNSTDGKANIGYATSADGISWTKYPANPIIVTGTNSWDSTYVQDPHVIKENGEYHMWFGGGQDGEHYDQQVGYAVSADGITWVKSPLNPVLTRGNSGTWDDILSSFPSVLNDDGEYKMWYTGRDQDPLPNSFNYYWEIGYAEGPILGIETLANSESISIFPNPVNDLLNIDIPSTEDLKITISTIIGQVVLMESNKNIIDVSALAKGTYVVTVVQGKSKHTATLLKD